MSNDRTFYTMTENGPAEKAWKEFTTTHRATMDSWCEFTKKYGATEYYAGDFLRGILLTKDQVPEGWLSPAKLPKNCYRPQRRKVCMDAYNEFSTLNGKPDGIAFSRMLGIDIVFAGSKVYFPTVEIVAGKPILSLHNNSEVPKGAVLLKTSDYWKLKEAEVETE